jgi:hypothetical protein
MPLALIVGVVNRLVSLWGTANDDGFLSEDTIFNISSRDSLADRIEDS